MFVLMLLGCGVIDLFDAPMGAACTRNEACEARGVCLKGVCSAYPCTADAQCADGMVCGDFGGARACATPCAGNTDCGGEQQCLAIAGGEGAEADLCM